MQATLPLQASHPVKSLVGLARQIALPHEYTPQRLPSFPALERTAVMGFSAPTSLNLPASTAVQVNVFRQATFPVWAQQTSLTQGYVVGFATELRVPFSATSGGLSNDYHVVNNVNKAILVNTTASSSNLGVSNMNTPVPWNSPLLGNDGGKQYFYKPAGIPLSVVVAAQLACPNSNFRVEIYAWTSPGEELYVDSLAMNSGATFTGAYDYSTMTAPYSWLRFSTVDFRPGGAQTTPANLTVYGVVASDGVSYTPSATTHGNVAFLVTSGASLMWPLVSPVEFYNAPLPWFATRTTACSFLGTNVSQVLVKGGTILAGRLSPAVISPWSVTQSYITGLHPAEKAYLALETGVYTYVPPSTDLSDFYDYTSQPVTTYLNTTSTTGLYPVFQLKNDSLYHTMFITAASTAEQLACTVDWHLEFRTSSALFQIGMSTMLLETLHQAQLALAELGYFFENPDHKKLKEKLAFVVNKYGPKALSVAGNIPGPVGTVSKAVQLILSAKPKGTPAPTSGAASGMTGKKSAPAKGKKDKRKGRKKK